MDPIQDTMARWKDGLRAGFPDGYDSVLHENCEFYSPVLFKPLRGREMTAMYLAAAGNVLPGGESNDNAAPGGEGTGKFRYTKEVLDGHHAVLEFETMVGDVSVNGVDIITCDDDGMITEFKVMLRPQRAVESVREGMAAMLEKMNG
jgi:hypothetical protein